MIRLGLCSGSCITRNAKEVLSLAVEAGLEAIEWAQDIHLPAGEQKAAEETMIATLSAGLTTASYATLYRAGTRDDDFHHFEQLLSIASILQAPFMRIYVIVPRKGEGGESEARLPETLKQLGDRAATKGITLCLSLGRGTGASTYSCAHSLVAEAAHPFVRLAWEDLPYSSSRDATNALVDGPDATSMVIARSSDREGKPRSIAECAEEWETRIKLFKEAETQPGIGRFVLFGAHRQEGTRGRESLIEDAKTLKNLVEKVQPPRRRS